MQPTEVLNSEEFRAGMALLANAYKTINPEFAVSAAAMQAFRANQVKVFYAKRTFGEIEKGNLDQVRALARDYRRSQGWANIFSLLWVASWLGRPVIQQVPRFYRYLAGWKTRQPLSGIGPLRPCITIFSTSPKLFIKKRALFMLMGFFCYAYTVFGSDFAEWEVKFGFLNFPIFVGEFLLLVTLLLVVVYYFKNPSFLDRIFFICHHFLCFVDLHKSVLGLCFCHPSAFRNAALFLLSVVRSCGYVLLERGLFNRRWRSVIPAFLILNLCFSPVSDYFVPAYWLLSLGFCLFLRPSWMKWFGITVLVARQFIQNSFLWQLIHVIGIAFMTAFLIGYLVFGLVKLHWRTKSWAVIIVVVVIMSGLLSFGDHNALRSMVSLTHLHEQYLELDNDIQRRKKYYVPDDLKPQIYYQNKDNQLAQNISIMRVRPGKA